MIGTRNGKTGCGFFRRVGTFIVGIAVGAAGYYVADHYILNKSAEEPGSSKVCVETGDAPSAYGVFKAGADADLSGMQSAMSSDYNAGRDGMKNVVTACKDVVDMEKAYIKSIYAQMPVLQGSANPDSLSLEMRLFAGNKAAVLKNNATGQEELVTESTILGASSHGLYPLPSEPGKKLAAPAGVDTAKQADKYANDPMAAVKDAYNSAVDKVTGYVRSLNN